MSKSSAHISQITQRETFTISEMKNYDWWQRKSGFEKTILYVAIIAIICSICVSAAVIYVFLEYGNTLQLVYPLKMLATKLEKSIGKMKPEEIISRLNAKNVCLTPGCIKAASYILKNMDNSTSPCDDFYQFACGNWLKENHIPDDKSSISMFSKIDDKLTYKLKGILEKNSSEADLPIFKAARIIYNQCNDEDAIDKVDDLILKKILKELGGWPVVEGNKWSEANFNWIDLTYKLRDLGYGYHHFFSVGVGVDYRHTENYIVSIGEAGLLQSRETLMKNMTDNVLASYYKLMVHSAILLGADKELAKKEMTTVMNFAKELAALTTPREDSRDASKFYNKMDVSHLSRFNSKIPWKQYLRKIIGKYFNEKKQVLVGSPKFLTKVQNLIDKTPKRVIANYIMWDLIRSSFIQLGKKWKKLDYEYSKAVTGLEVMPPRWRHCLRVVWSDFGIAMSSLYVREYFGKQNKATVSQMVADIHNEFVNILNNVDWMDAITVKHAKEKAMKMKFHVAFPDELLDNKKITEFYGNFSLNETTSYFKNLLELSLWGTDYSHSFLEKKNDPDEWWKSGRSAIVNAFYKVFDNAIQIPAGILQPPFFDMNVPKYLNYAGIGVVIGHEITHGFDDIGRQFDKDGNNKMWWNNDTDAKFNEKSQCIVNQYNQYTVIDGMKIKGVNTQGENIADNGGVKEAYHAYKNYEKKYGKELTLPGIGFTADQLFFINFANVWCRKKRPKSLKLSIELGAHSPAKFRVIGTLSNSVEFSKAFQCPLGSPMNPAKKCSVW